MTAFAHAWRDHQPSRLHTDWALRLLVWSEGTRRRIHNFNQVVPVDDSSWVIQILDVTTFLFYGKALPLFFCHYGGICFRHALHRLERLDDKLEGSLHVLFFRERCGGVAAVAFVSTLLSAALLRVRVLILTVFLSLEAQQVIEVFYWASKILHSTFSGCLWPSAFFLGSTTRLWLGLNLLICLVTVRACIILPLSLSLTILRRLRLLRRLALPLQSIL